MIIRIKEIIAKMMNSVSNNDYVYWGLVALFLVPIITNFLMKIKRILWDVKQELRIEAKFENKAKLI